MTYMLLFQIEHCIFSEDLRVVDIIDRPRESNVLHLSVTIGLIGFDTCISCDTQSILDANTSVAKIDRLVLVSQMSSTDLYTCMDTGILTVESCHQILLQLVSPPPLPGARVPTPPVLGAWRRNKGLTLSTRSVLGGWLSAFGVNAGAEERMSVEIDTQRPRFFTAAAKSSNCQPPQPITQYREADLS